MSRWIRKAHRWVSMAFVAGVIAYMAAMTRGQAPAWLGLFALVPLILLLVSGLYLFVLPYLKRPAAGGRMKDPVLLSGGNPQIAKGYGDAPVQAWIEAVPGWKRDVARRLDALVVATVPETRKAVKWNSPLYGVTEGEWFLGLHAYDRYLKLAFFGGAALEPPPPVASKQATVRYAHIHEEDRFDEARLADWIAQAARLPGARM